MRIGVIPEGLRDRVALRSRRFPQPLADVMGTMLLSRAVMAGVHFGVFDCLAQGPKTAAALAAETGCDQHGIRLLLDALVACGYLTQERDRYRNARLSTTWLLSGAPHTLVNFVRYNYDQWEWVSKLEDYLQRGESQDIHEKLGPAQWRRYLLGLQDIARLSADKLVPALKLRPAPCRLLDVGGGHCHYTITLCRRYPELRATVVDLEPAVRIGRELVEQAGLSHRIEFRPGHLAETPLGENYDVAFLFNVLHHLDEATNRETLRRLASALAPGGKLVVWESFREERENRQKDQLGSLLALFFGLTSKEETYGFGQVAAWARAAGFKRIRRQRLRTAPYGALLLAGK